MTKTVTALFKSSAAASEALFQLESAGFKKENVSVVATEDSIGNHFNIEKDNKSAEGGAIGAAGGGLVGAIAAGLAATGSIVIPGVNLLVYGAIISAAAGAGVGAAAGGLTGALIGLGIPEYEAKSYEKQVEGGSILLLVECKDDLKLEQAKSILEKQDAFRIAA